MRAKVPSPKIPESFRTSLNLTSQTIIDFFDAVIDRRAELVETDVPVSPEILQRRVERLKKMIADSKAIIEGMSVHVMKIRRAPDDPLRQDKARREQIKRHEEKRIKCANKLLFKYQKKLKTGDLCLSLWRITLKPVYFRDKVSGSVDIEQIDENTARWVDTKVVRDKQGNEKYPLTDLVYDAESGYINLEFYKSVAPLLGRPVTELEHQQLRALLGDTDAERQKTLRHLERWENQMIAAAVLHGVLRPDRAQADRLGLGPILDAQDEAVEIDHREEDAQAVKTGGASFNGRMSVRGEGFNKFARRAVSNFNKPTGRSGEGYSNAGSGSLRDTTDDAESYDTRGKNMSFEK